jgi:delta1-piperideine-2-carboxylate reductase
MSRQQTESAAEPRTRVPFDDLVELLRAIFLKNGTSENVAAILAQNCASAEQDGAESHGVFRIPAYLSTLHSEWVDGKAVPQIRNTTSAWLSVDAMNGFAQPALAIAAGAAAEKARECGIAAIAISNSHHFGALWLDVEPLTRAGFVVLTMVSGYRRVAPHGGRHPIYGTNPMAFGAPRAKGPPLIFDQASSATSFGDLLIAKRENRTVPLGSGLDRTGQETSDPAAILDGGALLTFGGHKGSSIAMMIEVMAAAVTGSLFSFEVDRSQYPGAETSRSGQFMLLIDPRFGLGKACAERVDDLVVGLRSSGQTRLPGDRRYEARKKAQAQGVSIRCDALANLRTLLQ